MLFAVPAFSQNDTSIQFGKPQPKEDLPTNIKETLAKQRIAREKKDYQELLDRSQEAVKLSEELEKSFAATNQLSVDDEKKLDRLEKLVKKIRSELGADSDDGEENIDDQDNNGKSSTMVNSLKTLQSKSSQLFDEIKKQTRYSVSVIAIQTSNTLLRIVKYIRFGK
ncbi:MAG: hypothetical protein ABJA66_01250 [Actinomycetota bacterium]